MNKPAKTNGPKPNASMPTAGKHTFAFPNCAPFEVTWRYDKKGKLYVKVDDNGGDFGGVFGFRSVEPIEKAQVIYVKGNDLWTQGNCHHSIKRMIVATATVTQNVVKGVKTIVYTDEALYDIQDLKRDTITKLNTAKSEALMREIAKTVFYRVRYYKDLGFQFAPPVEGIERQLIAKLQRTGHFANDKQLTDLIDAVVRESGNPSLKFRGDLVALAGAFRAEGAVPDIRA